MKTSPAIEIVIVDDQNTIKEFLKINLENVANVCIVDFASNGKEAIEAVEKHQPDIVIMDIEMPVMNGIEATKIISKRFIDVMVILFTTRNDKQQLNLALQSGARGYILKTTSPQDLVDIIQLTVKGFFNIGPILGEWNEGASSNEMESQSYKVSNLSQHLDMSQVLSELTDRIIELRRAVESQEDKIVNLTNRFSYRQREVNDRLNGNKLLKETKNSRPSSTRYSWDKRRQNTLFISGFFLGAIMVLAIVLLFMAINTFVWINEDFVSVWWYWESKTLNRLDDNLNNKLLTMLSGDKQAAFRLLTNARQPNPSKSYVWYQEKVIRDLERDRRS